MDALADKMHKILQRHQELEDAMMQSANLSAQEIASLGKKLSETEVLANLAKSYLSSLGASEEVQGMLLQEIDPEMKAFLSAERDKNEQNIKELVQRIKVEMLPKDEADHKNAIIEIRAGTGGDEAALFAAALLRMYQKYSEAQGWRFEILDISQTGLDGCKEVSASITGRDVFAKLKFESGVHRVQRVPETESSGRIHTSAATVAVLPEAEEVDVKIEDKDIRIDVFRASGAGGQHVNTTDSAVRITHIASGIVVSQQDEKSQHKNKAKALKILRARLYEAEREQKEKERSALRKNQVGSGDRSERIRTYNYPQSRITDHRINYTAHNLTEVINEGKLHTLIEALIEHNNAALLAGEGDGA